MVGPAAVNSDNSAVPRRAGVCSQPLVMRLLERGYAVGSRSRRRHYSGQVLALSVTAAAPEGDGTLAFVGAREYPAEPFRVLAAGLRAVEKRKRNERDGYLSTVLATIVWEDNHGQKK